MLSSVCVCLCVCVSVCFCVHTHVYVSFGNTYLLARSTEGNGSSYNYQTGIPWGVRVHQIRLQLTGKKESPMPWGPSDSVSLTVWNIEKLSLRTLTVVFCMCVWLSEFYYEVLLLIQYWESNKNLYWAALTCCLSLLHFSRCVLQAASVVKISVSVEKHIRNRSEIQAQVQEKNKTI